MSNILSSLGNWFASKIRFYSAGNLTSTNVQDAIQELDKNRKMRNLIINGNFTVNQRGQGTGVTLLANKYGHDRWRAGSSGCTYTFNTINPSTIINITAGSLQQVIEGVISIYGGTYTLSWVGTALGSINGGTFTTSPITVTDIPLGQNVTVEFKSGTLGLVQFEEGKVATQFEHRLVEQELHLCYRYFYSYSFLPGQVIIDNWESYTGGKSTYFTRVIDFKRVLRTTPQITLVGTFTTCNTEAPPGFVANNKYALIIVRANNTGRCYVFDNNNTLLFDAEIY